MNPSENHPLFCVCCDSSEMSAHEVLWQSLIDEWRLSEYEVGYINRQQGIRCSVCGCSLRSMALAASVMKTFGFEGYFKDFVRQPSSQKMNVLEINEAGDLTQFLSDLPKHKLAKYPEVDMMNLPFDNDCFDLVIHSDTLEHIPYPVRGLSECYRVLKPGGALSYTIPMIVDRLTASRQGLSPSHHAGAENPDDVLVHTEYGCDAWKDVIQSGFDECRIFSFEYPSAQVFTGLKLASSYLHNASDQLDSANGILKAKLREREGIIQKTQTNFHQAQTELQKTQTNFHQAQTELQKTQTKLQQVQTELQQAQSNWEHCQNIIGSMKNTKFWKLRRKWMAIKKRFFPYLRQ